VIYNSSSYEFQLFMTGSHSWCVAYPCALHPAIHADSRGTDGGRRVNAELLDGQGVIVNPKTVREIMRMHGLGGRSGSPKTSPQQGEQSAPAADLVERRFDRPARDQLWVADIERHEALLDRAVMGGTAAGPSQRAG
jgi:hypothetical protein